MYILKHVVPAQILDFKRNRKFGAQIMRGSRLNGTPVFHHRFNGIRVNRTGKTFRRRLLAGNDRDRQIAFYKITVDLQHPHRFFTRFSLIFMGGVAFLPEKLARADERQCAFLPADYVRPLIDQDRQITVRLNPFGIHMADHRF
ncbi:hypothetical protein D3C87_1560260 [compost metagenome]